ncbi:MAG: diaminopimelate epimerase [Planktotalea sp.]|uniref:diaminopimelate epimerase n=1 Tax=Planktotalea sp. TaxID=2029877 RepID=UPI003C733AB4
MASQTGTSLPFMKMHGLGNDFVVFDERASGPLVTQALVIAMADRHCGVGYDQLVAIRSHAEADIELVFWNADGSIAGACGNATRCIAGWELARRKAVALNIRTERGLLHAVDAGNGDIEVNMGQPLMRWDEIPLAREIDTLELPIEGAPTATGMGNPHCTFFVDDVEAIDLEAFGPTIEHHPLFPERTNVQIAQITGPNQIRMRVWERGVGITLASGSSSCAVAVAATRRGLIDGPATLQLDGGEIRIKIAPSGVLMTGAWAHVFDGHWRGIR